MFLLVRSALSIAQPEPPETTQSEDLQSLVQWLRQHDRLEDFARSLKVREQVVVLGKRTPQAVVPQLVTELTALRATPRQAVNYQLALIGILEQIGPAAEAAVPVLTSIVQDSTERNDSMLLKAGMALRAIGTPAARDAETASSHHTVEQWAQKATPAQRRESALQHAYFIRRELRRAQMHEEMIRAAAVTLRALGSDAAPAIPDVLRAWADPRVGTPLRTMLAQTLASARVTDIAAAARKQPRSPTPPSPLAAIRADIWSDIDLVSSQAISELGETGISDEAIDILIHALRERRHPGDVALVLGNFGPAAKRAIPALLPHITDRETGANCIQALSKIGPNEPQVVVALRKVVADPQSPHRAMAASALGRTHSPHALPELRKALSASDKYTIILAAQSIGELGATAAPTVPDLMPLLKNPDVDIQTSAVEALGKIGPAAASAVPQIEPLLQMSEQKVKDTAVTALERIGEKSAKAAIARDARRYAAADLRESVRLRQRPNSDGLSTFLKGLPQARQILLARELLKDPNPLNESLGISVLLREGLDNEAIPALATLLLKESKVPKPRPLGGYFIHNGLISPQQMQKLCAHITEKATAPPQGDWEHLRKQLCPMK